MRKTIFFVFMALLYSCKKERADVLVQDLSISTKSSFNKVRFIGDKAIIIGGQRFDETAIYILNADQTLTNAALPGNITNKELYGIDISSDGRVIAVGYDASVMVSADSGINWQFTQNGTWKNFQDIAFRDANTAYIVSHLGFAIGGLASVNSDGNGSTFLLEERNFAIDDIDFADAQTGYLCGYGAIMKTVDGGQTWTFTSAQNDYFKAMSWKNAQEGIAVGYAGSILQTSDGGATWHTNRNGNNFLKKKIHFLAIEHNGNNIYMATGEKGFVCISYNNGDTWTEVKNFTDKDLRGLYFKNETECAVVGADGGLFLLKL